MLDPPFTTSPPPAHAGVLPRRRLLVGGAVLSSGLLGACTPQGRVTPRRPSVAPTPAPHDRQSGVSVPAVRQAHLHLVVADVADPTRLATLLARLGQGITAAVAAQPDLTATVGVGPDALTALGRRGVGTADLPRFAHEQIPGTRRGGDLLLQVCADTAGTAEQAATDLLAPFADQLRPRWQVAGFRGAVDDTGARNLLGFYDGVSVPKTPDDLEAHVWLGDDTSVAVVRLMPVDVSRFERETLAHQEQIIGRRKDSGAPLSGGPITADPDLQAKSDAGVYAIAVDAHVRRAHPLPAGLDGLMLRRSYSYRSGGEQGLVFIAFMRSLDMFVRTQQRMDESDALMAFTRTTASGTFLILPGFTPDRPLGATLH